MTYAQTEIRQHNGLSTIFVNGKPLHGMMATSGGDNEEAVKAFVRADVDIFQIWIEAGIHCWKGKGEYDWSYAEKKLELYERIAPNQKWLIRFRLGLINHWFGRAYPDEVLPDTRPDANGNFRVPFVAAIIHSPTWLNEIRQLIFDFSKWLSTTRWAPKIIGFVLHAGRTEEWLPFETDDLYRGVYSPVYARELRAWLRKTYKNDETALRKAWGKPDVTFETAECPTGMLRKGSHIWGPYSFRDPRKDRAAIDYYRFLNDTLADHYIAVCRSAKEGAGTPIIVGGVFAYLWWETGVYSYIQEYGHTYIQRLVESPWVDMVASITTYDCRYPGGPSGYLGLPTCINLHGKLHGNEADLVTFVNLPKEHREAWQKADTSKIAPRTAEPVIPDRVWNWEHSYAGRDAEEQVAIFQREEMLHLVNGTAQWWFDIRNNNYREPVIVETLRRLSHIARQAIHWNRQTVSQVAFVVSEDTPEYQAAMNGTLMRFELESLHGLLIDVASRRWGLAGVPYDKYELNDLRHPNFPGDRYKLIVFLNCGRITPQAAEGIRRWQRDGRVLCWTYAPGIVDDEQINPRLSEGIIGIRLGWRNQRQNIHILFDDKGHPLTQGGAALNYGTEGSVGPVFFADDPNATVLGHLRDGGEPAVAVRDHSTWKSVYLAMINFGPQVLRNLTSFANAHVWSETDDVLYANHSLLCLHSACSGHKSISLPQPAIVTDLWSGEKMSALTRRIDFDMPSYRTRLWRTDYMSTSSGGGISVWSGSEEVALGHCRLDST